MDDDDEDEIVYAEELSEEETLAIAAHLPVRHSKWIYLSLALGTAKEILDILTGSVHALETIIHQRYTWEQERQSFSDSVKSDFLSLPVKEADAPTD